MRCRVALESRTRCTPPSPPPPCCTPLHPTMRPPALSCRAGLAPHPIHPGWGRGVQPGVPHPMSPLPRQRGTAGCPLTQGRRVQPGVPSPGSPTSGSPGSLTAGNVTPDRPCHPAHGCGLSTGQWEGWWVHRAVGARGDGCMGQWGRAQQGQTSLSSAEAITPKWDVGWPKSPSRAGAGMGTGGQ